MSGNGRARGAQEIPFIETSDRTRPAFSSRVWWARAQWPRALVGKFLPPASPPLLIISLPRSGSSWLATILGSAREALLLREPINQGHLAMGGATTVFDVDPAAPPDAYARLAACAFEAIPLFPSGVAPHTEQWGLLSRTRRRVVIKEVNPLALAWLLAAYKPRVIFLLRHPAAIARSYWSLNWRNAEDKLAELLGSRLLQGSLRPWQETIRSATGFWQAHGVFQGAVIRTALEALEGYPDVTVVTYESLCENPESAFGALFEFAGLTFDDAVRDLIAASSMNTTYAEAGQYGTQRNTHQMAYAWKAKLSPAELESLHSGYAAFGLPHYHQKKDWTPETP